jgi:hypothetical protein
MSPLRYRVIIEEEATTREPTDDELRHIVAYVGRYVTECGVEPIGAHEVPGVAQLVWYQHSDN